MVLVSDLKAEVAKVSVQPGGSPFRAPIRLVMAEILPSGDPLRGANVGGRPASLKVPHRAELIGRVIRSTRPVKVRNKRSANGERLRCGLHLRGIPQTGYEKANFGSTSTHRTLAGPWGTPSQSARV